MLHVSKCALIQQVRLHVACVLAWNSAIVLMRSVTADALVARHHMIAERDLFRLKDDL